MNATHGEIIIDLFMSFLLHVYLCLIHYFFLSFIGQKDAQRPVIVSHSAIYHLYVCLCSFYLFAAVYSVCYLSINLWLFILSVIYPLICRWLVKSVVKGPTQ